MENHKNPAVTARKIMLHRHCRHSGRLNALLPLPYSSSDGTGDGGYNDAAAGRRRRSILIRRRPPHDFDPRHDHGGHHHPVLFTTFRSLLLSQSATTTTNRHDDVAPYNVSHPQRRLRIHSNSMIHKNNNEDNGQDNEKRSHFHDEDNDGGDQEPPSPPRELSQLELGLPKLAQELSQELLPQEEQDLSSPEQQEPQDDDLPLARSKFGRVVESTDRQIARVKRIVSCGKSKLWKDIIEIYQTEQHENDFGWVDLSTTLSQLARIKAFPASKHPILRDILQSIADRLDNDDNDNMVIDPRYYSNICHSIGKFHSALSSSRQDDDDASSRRIINHLANAQFAQDFLHEANPQDIANVSVSLVQLHRPDLMKSLLSVIDDECRMKLFTGQKAQAAVNIIWAGIKLDQDRSSLTLLLAALEQKANWLVKKGTPHDISQAALACATLGYKSPPLFRAIANFADWLVANGDPTAISNTAYAFATFGHKAPALFKAIQERIDWFVTKGKPAEIANMVWAFAKLSHDASALLASIEKRSDWLVSNGPPQSIARTVWTFAMLDYKSTALLTAIEKRSDWLVAKGSAQDIADTAWAFATLDHKSPALFAAIEKRSDWLANNDTPQGIANTV
jgi:hypothetical protein